MDCECKGRNPNCLKCDGRGYRTGGMFTVDAVAVDIKNDIEKNTPKKITKKKVIQLKKRTNNTTKKVYLRNQPSKGIPIKLISQQSSIPIYKIIDVLVKSGNKRKNLNETSFINVKNFAILKKKFRAIK